MLSDRDLGTVVDRLPQVDPAYVFASVRGCRWCIRRGSPRTWRGCWEAGLGVGGHPREPSAGAHGRVSSGRSSAHHGRRARLESGCSPSRRQRHAETLEGFFRGLVRAGVKPYYLFQGDLAAGTAHFRVPLEKGIALMRELRARLPGLRFRHTPWTSAGGGKVPVESSLLRTEQDAYVLRGPDGREYGIPGKPEPACAARDPDSQRRVQIGDGVSSSSSW